MAILKVPVVKAKTTRDIDTDALSLEVLTEATILGLKVLLNRGTSKITKSTIPDEAELKAEAEIAADKQIALIQSSKIKFAKDPNAPKAASLKGVAKAINTEAMRLARNMVKDELKRAGKKLAHYPAATISAAAAKALAGPAGAGIVAQAEANLAERERLVSEVVIDVESIEVSDKLVAAAEKAKAEKKSQLSAKQAGQTVKAKGKGKGKPTPIPTQAPTAQLSAADPNA